MKTILSLSLHFLIIFFVKSTLASSKVTFDVSTFGAKPDGRTDSTKAFLGAWAAACNSTKPAKINVPQGKYLLGSAAFWGNKCRNKAITIRLDGTLVAPSDYNVIGKNGNWLKFERVDGLTISGGVLDGQGTGLWACKASGKSCPSGATTIAFYNSNNVVISKLSSLNSQLFHIVVDGCRNVQFQGVKITASGTSKNTDGIHIEGSSYVTISSTKISTGDDCVSIGPGSTNLWIENVVCGPGHGISIGSLGWDAEEAGVQNVTVKTVTFSGTQNGLRIKTWARPSSGFVKNVLFQHAVMSNVKYPIIIDQNYCPDKNTCPRQVSGVKISGLTYEDIHGTSATKIAIMMGCSKDNPCSGIRLQDVNLKFNNQAAQVSCSNAAGSSSGYMDPSGCL